MWVQSLGRKDPLKEGVGTHSHVLDWRIPMDRGAWQAIVHGVTNSQTRLSDETTGPKDLGSSHPRAAHHCSRLYRVRL